MLTPVFHVRSKKTPASTLSHGDGIQTLVASFPSFDSRLLGARRTPVSGELPFVATPPIPAEFMALVQGCSAGNRLSHAIGHARDANRRHPPLR